VTALERPRLRITLGAFFALALGGVALLLSALYGLVVHDSQQALTAAAGEVGAAVGARVALQIEEHLGQAEAAVDDLARQLAFGVVGPDDLDGLEARLYAALLAHPHLVEATLTRARAVGFAEHGGAVRLAPGEHLELTVSRAKGGGLDTRRLRAGAGPVTLELRARPKGGSFASAAFTARTVPAASLPDPTDHDTFKTPANRHNHGRSIWSDLSYAQLDAALPEDQRRRVVSVQRAVFDATGAFLGVARASVASDEVDRIAAQRGGPQDPHRSFLCDTSGRLITRLDPADRLALLDESGKPDPEGDLRVVPVRAPAEISAALLRPELASLEAGGTTTVTLRAGGRAFLATFSALPARRTQGWVVGITVSEQAALGPLVAARRHLLGGVAAIGLGLLLLGALALRALRRGFGRLTAEIRRMQHFEFAAAPPRSAFRDVHEALTSLELAKTALRAMGRYVPIDLVRQLYQSGVEPVLGAQPRELTLLFSDIKDFTAVSERLPADRLAAALGAYLEQMTSAIESTGGTIDKYIGDAVMALWNAPAACADHPRAGCRAALACTRATAALCASTAWEGLAPWQTRFGLHSAQVMVGHFGAPNRISYTAIGDGVNLASRLEGLNKQYGTSILVSAPLREAVGQELVFRHLDRVAVKGKRVAMDVYELCGEPGEAAIDRRLPALRRYEAALQAYFARRFEEALELLQGAESDPPSAVLRARCEALVRTPPDPAWDGVYVAQSK
jgi:adenylate cyclase